MSILVKSLEDEIRAYIEGNDSEAFLNENQIKALSEHRDFSFFRYMYKQGSIKDSFLKDESLFDFLKRISPIGGYTEAYRLLTANPLLVGIRKTYKPVNQSLSDKYLKNGIRLTGILDIEFFEFYENQYMFLKSLFSKENELINLNGIRNVSLNLYNLIRSMNLAQIEEFRSDCEVFGYDLTSVIDFLDCEREVVSKHAFSAFLDTEKIHLQFGIAPQGEDNELVLIYYGYGNYYPFTRNISRSNASEKRFLRFDATKGDFFSINYLQEEVKKSHSQRMEELLLKLDYSQENYREYFVSNFSYEQRRKEYGGVIKPVGQVLDDFFRLPDEIRTKASALVAYKYFRDLI